MKQSSWELADTIALELVGRETDVNEVQKVATHARVQAERNAGRVGEDFFALLETMVNDGHHLVRSGQTLYYYRDLRDVCSRHLRNFRQTSPEGGWELVGILGWAARLMRYYKSPEGKTELTSKQRGAGAGESVSTAVPTASAPPQPRSAPEEQQPKRQTPRPPSPPKARPREETAREKVTLISPVKGGKARVRTEMGDEVTCTGMPSYPPAEIGEECRANVTRENGRALRAIFKGRV